jgi:hypothetical protein
MLAVEAAELIIKHRANLLLLDLEVQAVAAQAALVWLLRITLREQQELPIQAAVVVVHQTQHLVQTAAPVSSS